MNNSEIVDQRNLCIDEEPPFCENDCPLGIDVRAVIGKIAEGDFTAAAKLLQKKTPFARTLSRICTQPCRQACPRAELGGAINVRGLERACLAYGDPSRSGGHFASSRKSGLIAVVGGGITGLTCAHNLSSKGYSVHLFEKEEVLGGMLRAIPSDALPSDVLEADIADAVRKVHVHLGYEVRNLDELKVSGDAPWNVCLVATGTDGATFDLETANGIIAITDPVAGSTSRENVFATGGVCGIRDLVFRMADALRTARTIERCLKGASLSLGREKELNRETCLYVETADTAPEEAIPEPKEGYTREAAIGEAARCLQCSCGECGRACSLMTDIKQLPKRILTDIGKTLGAISQLTEKANMRTVNSCNQCGLCVQKCPTGLDMGALFLETRRILRERGEIPPAFHDFFLRDMEFANGPQAACTITPAKKLDYLFFPGCQLGASNPIYVTRGYEYLCETLGDNTVGLKTGCCGAPLEWAGADKEFHKEIARFREEWEQLGKPRIVLACPTCAKEFRRNCADIPVISLWEIMREHGLPDGAVRRFEGVAIDLFDPCSSRFDPAAQDAVRWVLAQTGCEITELSNRREARCCGYGGLIYGANPHLAEKIAEERLETSQHSVVTYCSNCRDVFAAKGKTAFHLLDLVFNLGFPEDRGIVSLGDRRTNREIVRCKALGLPFEPKPPKNITVICPPPVIKKMNAQLLLFEEVEAAVINAENHCEKLYDQEKDTFITHLQTGLITCWVEYIIKGCTATVSNVYSHRMTILK